MHIWVDADACPGAIKDILYRAANRACVPVTLVANRLLRVPVSAWIRTLQVPGDLDAADDRIAAALEPGDLVVTADVPLAARAVEKGGFALDPRGTFMDAGNIRELLTLRNFMDELRGSGVDTGGPGALSSADRQRFANCLDGFLTRVARDRSV